MVWFPVGFFPELVSPWPMIQSSQVQYPEIENVPRDFPFWPEAAETAADPGPLEELEESEPFCWLSLEDEELEEDE